MRQFFLFISLYFFLFLSHFICSYLFSLPFPFLLSLSSFSFPFNLYPCILIIILFFVHLFSSPSENHKRRRLKIKHLEDESKHHQRPFISLFLDAALVGERTTGTEVATLQYGGGVAEDEVDGALSYSRAE